MAAGEVKNFNTPDETRQFGHGHVDLVKIGAGTVGRSTFESGWRWSQDVKPIAKTDLCQVHHFGYLLSGHMGVRMEDGSEMESGPGDVLDIPGGHDAWVIGSETVVMIDWAGATHYAER